MTFKIYPKLKLKTLPSNKKNIKFKKNKQSELTHLEITIDKAHLEEAKTDAQFQADKITRYLKYKFSEFITASLVKYKEKPSNKIKKSVTTKLTLKHSSEASPNLEFDDKEYNNLLNLNEEQYGLLCRYVNALDHFKLKFYEEAFKELFSIIEYETHQSFQNYDAYYALRQLLAHTPSSSLSTTPYRPKNIQIFVQNYKNDFHYINFDPKHNLIIIDKNHDKTKSALYKIVKDLLKNIKHYLNNKWNL